jgi:O-acetyl-ADP-ribose deacetylase (regulator of RNase III)
MNQWSTVPSGGWLHWRSCGRPAWWLLSPAYVPKRPRRVAAGGAAGGYAPAVPPRRPSPLSLLLVDPDRELVNAWESAFADQGGIVAAHHGVFQDRYGDFDALVAPGNSYGQMDGGIDGVISREFRAVQRNVWDAIGDEFQGYQPVGTAQLVETGDPRCGWLVYAPTMRIPMALDRGRDVAIHDALWAALAATDRFNRGRTPEGQIRTLACPGLGTGIGRVRPERAAKLMSTAFRFWSLGSTASISHREAELI